MNRVATHPKTNPYAPRACRALLALIFAVGCGRPGPLSREALNKDPAPGPAVSGTVVNRTEMSHGAQAARPPETCTPPPGLKPRRPIAQVMGASNAAWLDRADRERIEPRGRILDALRVAPGEAIADVGAGTGYYTVPLARRVGAKGRVVATDVQPDMLRKLAAKLRTEGLDNVKTVLATEADAGLEPASFDLALMVDVYHELAKPFETLAQIRCALNERGRLALLEYRAEDPAVAIRPEHKMRAEDVVAEIEPVGFRLSDRIEILPQHHIFVFVKAPPQGAPGGPAAE